MAVVTKEFVACSDIDVVAGECNATQVAVGAATFKVDLGDVSVDVLFTFLLLVIDSERTAVAFTLLVASYNRGRD